VYVAATLNTRVSPDHIIGLYTTVGDDYFDILVRPRVNQAFKDEIVKYRSVDVAPHREQIRETVRKRLTEELQSNSIAVDDLLLDNIWFSDQFEKAIENKQEQTQNALAEHEKVEAEHQRAQQAIEVAEGQASANAKLAASITPELIQWQAVQKLAPNVEIMMIPSGANFIMPPELLTKARRSAPAPGPGPTP
jgi:regulator of protease activity HflC (stomatin/prohibitin superfamily)